MTENKRFISSGNWIKDNNIDRLLNIDFNTTIDRDMCCKLLNQLEDKKSEYVKISDKYFEENKQLKQFKENVIKWVDSQMKFNGKKYIETEDYHFKSENVDLHNFKVFIGID